MINIIFFIIIAIIKNGRRYKAGRERLTRYQSEVPTPCTIPTHEKKVKVKPGENEKES